MVQCNVSRIYNKTNALTTSDISVALRTVTFFFYHKPILFWIPEKILTKIKLPQKILAKILFPPKIPKLWISNPKKSFAPPRHFKSGVSPWEIATHSFLVNFEPLGYKMWIFIRLVLQSTNLLPSKCCLQKRHVLEKCVSDLSRCWHSKTSSYRNTKQKEVFGCLRQCSEIVGTSSEIQVLWIQKSHAFDSGKVGRYTLTINHTS